MSAATAAMLWICAAGAALVFVAILASILRFPHAHRADAASRNVREFIWALVPIVIVIAAAAPSLQEHAISPQPHLAKRTTGDASPPAAHSELELQAAATHR